jgi:hypothetical protein
MGVFLELSAYLYLYGRNTHYIWYRYKECNRDITLIWTMSSRNYPRSKMIHNKLCYCLGMKNDYKQFQLAWRLGTNRNGVTCTSREWILIRVRYYRRMEIQTRWRLTAHCELFWTAFAVQLVRLRLKCNSTRAETRFRLSAKRMSPFKSARGLSSVDYWQPRCEHQR